MWDPYTFSWGCVASGKLPCFIFFTLPLENKGRAKPCCLQEKPVPATSSLVWGKCAFAMESVKCCYSPTCVWASRACSEVMKNRAELRGSAGWLAGMCFPHPTYPGCGNKCLDSASGPECIWVSLSWGGALTCAEWRVYFMTWGVVRWGVSTQSGMVVATKPPQRSRGLYRGGVDDTVYQYHTPSVRWAPMRYWNAIAFSK